MKLVGSSGVGDSQFKGCIGIAVDPKHNIVVADCINRRIQIFNDQGGIITKFTVNNLANGVTVDGHSNIIIAAEDHVEIRSPIGELIHQFGSKGQGEGQFIACVGVVVNSKGNLIVSDFSEHGVREFSPDGKEICKLQTGVGKRMDCLGIALDRYDNIYICDATNNCIQKFAPSVVPGETYRFVAQIGKLGETDGNFKGPHAVSVDYFGHLVVIDKTTRAQIFAPDGSFITSIMLKTDTSQKGVYGVGVDRRGNIYVADRVGSNILQSVPFQP